MKTGVWLKQMAVVTAGCVMIVAVLVAIVKILQFVPLPQTSDVFDAYWAAPWQGGFLWQQVGMLVVVLMDIWLLWVVPVAGGLLVYLAWGQAGEEAIGDYMVRIHEVEKALKFARDQADEIQGTWGEFNQKLDELFDGASEAFLVVGGGRSIRRWNKAAIELARRGNVQVDHLEGRMLEDVVNESVLLGAVVEANKSKKVWSGEVLVHKIGLRLMVWVLPMGDDVLLVLRDVTPLHREQGFLQNTEILLRQTVEDSVRPIAVLDSGWRYLYVARTWHETMGLPENTQLIGVDHRQIMPDFPPDLRVVEQQLQGGQAVGREEERRVLQGKDVVWRWRIRPWRDAGGALGGYIFTVVDMTEMVRLRQQVVEAEGRENALAYSDALTGLPNRQLFNDRLGMALAQAYRQLGKVALLFLDLDGFKQVNDQMGHDYGDLLLKQVAERLKAAVRTTDTVARLGGDEFTIILAVRERGDAEQVAKKLLEVISAPYDLNGRIADSVGTSIGIAMYPQDGSQAADLMKKADNAMYAAKQAGKRTYRFATREITIVQ